PARPERRRPGARRGRARGRTPTLTPRGGRHPTIAGVGLPPRPEPTMTLLICRTCPRYDTPNNREFRRALDAQIAQTPAADPRTVRHVQCLGGCPEDGVAAVDGPGNARVRFNGLSADDADALVHAAQAHADCPTGGPDEWDTPPNS